MNKYIIGVLSPTRHNDMDPFDDSVRFVTNYPKRIKEIDCIPLGLLFPNGRFIEELADLCDAFVITGGPDVESVGINLVHYAIKNNKPLLGVCLGMQTMAGYQWVIDKLGKSATYEQIDDFYKHEYEDQFLGYISNHDNVDPFSINDIEKSKHDVIITDKNSKLFRIFENSIISMPSLHKQNVIYNNLNNFKVVAQSEDNIIEALEYTGDNFILGVQFHPELEEKNIKIFKALKSSIKSK